MGEVRVEDYDPGWPDAFEGLRAAIWPAVSDIAISIEHVGSTAVPGLAAKPVIDLDVVVRADQVATGITRLTALGYEHRGDLGIPDREAFAQPAGSPRHHLYLCPSNSEALANHLAVRNHLRAHPQAAHAYGELKQGLARRFADDIDGYIEGKTAFLVDILRKAGFRNGTLREIEQMNRRPDRRGASGETARAKDQRP